RKVANFISGAEIGSLAKSTIYPTFSLKLYCQSTRLRYPCRSFQLRFKSQKVREYVPEKFDANIPRRNLPD
ncbi:MAG: hypothetical protein L0Y75_02745, partial [Acidobacteria bacterium]|nr:hypothetical protein [Acidobacteriota bacterium]